MSEPLPIRTADREFVRRCLDAYFARLPAHLRTGWRRPQMCVAAERFAYAVHPDMQDGAADPDGRCRWKWLQAELEVGWWFEPEELPVAFWAYYHLNRVCRFLLRDERSAYLLPTVPVRAPWLPYQKLVDSWQTDFWSSRPNFWPLGWSEDGAEVVCADMHRRDADGDAPIVTFDRETVCRLRPRLIRSDDARPLLAPLARPLFGSFRAMLGHYCLGPGCRWTGHEPDPQPRAAVPIPPPFDWEPWLEPEPAPDRPAPDQTHREPDPRAVAEHLRRIAMKIRAAGSLDPARLAAGSEWHEYGTNPRLSAAERQAFEATQGGRLPEAYAQFLMQVGNGGAGPGGGLRRLEESMLGWYEGDVPLSVPFPHRALWVFEGFDAAVARWHDLSEEERRPFHGEPIPGCVVLSKWPNRGGPAYAVLVITGPERGHVWVDRRVADDDDDEQVLFPEGTPRGIVPVMRRGPYSFLAWFESDIDALLDQAELLYQSIRASGADSA